MTLQAGAMFAGYRIEAVAGRGAMGIVYRATQPGTDRTVALKIIDPTNVTDAGFRERFARESKILASLDHPNVIDIYAASDLDGKPYIAMRYVEGTDLHSLIDRDGPLGPRRATRIVVQIAAALDAAHARGIVHRDVKPENVMISSAECADHAYLCDFGIAKDDNAAINATGTGRWVGTPAYAAPEQMQGAGIDSQADVYALGGLLFHALTGRPPYPAVTDVPSARIEDPPPSLRKIRADVPAALDRVIATAMAKDPAKRYKSAGDLGRAATAAAGLDEQTSPASTQRASSSRGVRSFGQASARAILMHTVSYAAVMALAFQVGRSL